MPRKAWCLLLLPVFAIGCQQPEMDWPPKKPDISAEMKKLELMVGTWQGTAEMVSPTVEEMRKFLGEEKGKNLPDHFEGQMTTSWTMDGAYLKSEGWHEFGGGAKSAMMEYFTWDPHEKKYRTWYFSDYGEQGTSTMTVSEDGKTFRFKGKGVDLEGHAVNLSGRMTFVDNNTIEWDWTEAQGFMKFEMKGVSKRKS